MLNDDDYFNGFLIVAFMFFLSMLKIFACESNSFLIFDFNLENPVIKFISTPFLTGLGIILGNGLMNFFKREFEIRDKSKIFALVIKNQLDNLYNIKNYLKKIQQLFGFIKLQSIGQLQTEQTIKNENLIEIIQQKNELIKYRCDDISSDSLYSKRLDEIYIYEGENLQLLVMYSRKLKILLEDLKNFLNHDFPVKIKEYHENDDSNKLSFMENLLFSKFVPVDELDNRCNHLMFQVNLALLYAMKNLNHLKGYEAFYDEKIKLIKCDLHSLINLNKKFLDFYKDDLLYLEIIDNAQNS